MNKRVFIILNIILPLLVGIALYGLLSPNIRFFEYFESVFGIKPDGVFNIDDNIPIRLIRNYLLDMLWAYALVFSLYYVTGSQQTYLRRISVIAASFSGTIEFLQLLPYVRGTFDILDIVVELVSIYVAVLIIIYSKRRQCRNEN